MMKRILTIVLALMLGVCVFAGCSNDGYDKISAKEAKTMMDTKTNYVIVDVRRTDEFATGHIRNAINLPNETIEFYAEQKLPNKFQIVLLIYSFTLRIKKDQVGRLGLFNIILSRTGNRARFCPRFHREGFGGHKEPRNRVLLPPSLPI